MPYCTTADVLKQLALSEISATSDPSITDVDQYCIDISAEMDARMRAVGVALPVTDADRLIHLNEVAVNGVAAKVLRAKTVKGGDPEWADTYQGLYDAKMARIVERPAIVGATDYPGQPEGTERDDDDIQVTRLGTEW
jgi:hypothetical protein